MKPSSHHRLPGTSRAPAPRRREDAFALVVTLLILSLLLIVSVSYLSSMSAEHQTADAFTSSVGAEQAARTGVDAATGMLAECFRDYPDSATVWDQQQSSNTNSPSNTAIVNGTYNEGTSLYLRAVPSTADATVANPLPSGVAYTNGGTSYAASDINGNDPNNPGCQTFVLPLISGVPGGRPKLVTSKASVFTGTGSPGPMDLSVSDPVKQTWTDLNVRQVGGDSQGVIGSPPGWTGYYPSGQTIGTPTGPGPKPARAYWINLTGAQTKDPVTGQMYQPITGRYAFWIDDESFRANVNKITNNAARPDNTTSFNSTDSPLPSTPKPLAPENDVSLTGALTAFDSSAASDASQVLSTRDAYPGKFLADPKAFLHSPTDPGGASTFNQSIADGLRYLTTTQSGTLNLSRHGTQRVNLNATTTINPTVPVTMPEIRKLVEAVRFHLPNFGQRFYRLKNPDSATYASQRSSILNSKTDVLTPTTAPTTPHSEIYLYKVAANLRDYIDQDDLPTLIVAPRTGTATPTLPTIYNDAVPPPIGDPPPLHPWGSDGKGDDGTNYLWAQGKDGAPFIQETVVRYRPAVQASTNTYTLTVDYYVEVWNMSNHDVAAASLGPHPFLRIGNQQAWASATITAQSNGKPVLTAIPISTGNILTNIGTGPSTVNTGSTRDFNLDLVNGVSTASSYTGPSVAAPAGVIFKAGTATVITTDPDFVSNGAISGPNQSVIYSRYVYGGNQLTGAGLSLPNVYYCSIGTPANNAARTFTGPLNPLGYTPPAGTVSGIMPIFRGSPSGAGTLLDYETEVTLGTDSTHLDNTGYSGYIDCALGAFCIFAGSGDGGSTATSGYDFTWTASGDPHNDYLHCSYFGGNSLTPSQLGDPRSDNEQTVYTTFAGSSTPTNPDQARFTVPGTSFAPPATLGLPNSNIYFKTASTASGFFLWPDFYDWPTSGYPTTSITAATAPAIIADAPLTSIGQLGDLFDPARVVGTSASSTIYNTRGGGRTFKIGQRDDRSTYDASGNVSPYNTVNNVPASNGWASWRLTDVFCVDNPLELPARININGVPRDGGAALRAALTGFIFQPTTTTDALVHGAPASASNTTALASVPLKYLPTDANGVTKLVTQISNRLALPPSKVFGTSTNGYNTPWGPFFERGEFGELENDVAGAAASANSIPLFGRNPINALPGTNKDLTASVDLGRTFDRGREELFRRIAELICTRGDTFTVYTVGQSLLQPTAAATPKITGTQRMRVTFRLVPKQYLNNAWVDFHPGYTVSSDGSLAPTDFNPETTAGLNTRFAKPDRYEVQVLSASTY